MFRRLQGGVRKSPLTPYPGPQLLEVVADEAGHDRKRQDQYPKGRPPEKTRHTKYEVDEKNSENGAKQEKAEKPLAAQHGKDGRGTQQLGLERRAALGNEEYVAPLHQKSGFWLGGLGQCQVQSRYRGILAAVCSHAPDPAAGEPIRCRGQDDPGCPPPRHRSRAIQIPLHPAGSPGAFGGRVRRWAGRLGHQRVVQV